MLFRSRVLDYLKEKDMLDNTLVVYTSDQGFYMGEHGWFDKRFMYDFELVCECVFSKEYCIAGFI